MTVKEERLEALRLFRLRHTPDGLARSEIAYRLDHCKRIRDQLRHLGWE